MKVRVRGEGNQNKIIFSLMPYGTKLEILPLLIALLYPFPKQKCACGSMAMIGVLLTVLEAASLKDGKTLY